MDTPVAEITPQTVIVPPADAGPVAKEAAPAASQPPPVKGKPLVRRLLMMAVLLLVLTILILAGRFVWRFVSASKEVTITYWGLWEGEAIVKPVIAKFEAQHSKIKVQYVKQSHRQYRERLQAAINRGEGPDVFRFHNTWLPMLKNELAVVPETVIKPAEFSAAFYPVATSDLVAGNAIYGIPLMIDGLGLYYNEDLLSAAGVMPPTTWEEVLNIVPKLTVKNEGRLVTSAIALGAANNVEHFSDILATMFMQNGANLISLSGKEAEEALLFYRKFADKNDPLYTWDETLDNSIVAFANGRVAMIMAPSWRAFDIRELNSNLRFKIAPIPQLPGNTVTWASYWVEGVSAKSKNSKAAWEFAKYLTSKEAAQLLYSEAAKSRLFGEPYARLDLKQMLVDDPYLAAYLSQGPTARSFPLASRTFDNGLNDKLIKYLEDAVNGLVGGAAPSGVLQTASAGFRQVLSSYGLITSSPGQ